MMFGFGRAGSPSRPVYACTPFSPGGSEIRPYQQPSSHIWLAKHTRVSVLPSPRLSELSLDHAKRLFPEPVQFIYFRRPANRGLSIRGPDGSAGIAEHAVAFRTADRFETRFHTQPPVCLGAAFLARLS